MTSENRRPHDKAGDDNGGGQTSEHPADAPAAASPSDLPDVTPPPDTFSLWTRIHTRKQESDVFRWLVNHVWWLLLIFVGLYALGALGIGEWRLGDWQQALDIMLGDEKPSAVEGPGYAAAVLLGLLGWLVVPAVVGAVAGLVIGLFTEPSVTQEELDEAVQRAVDKGTGG